MSNINAFSPKQLKEAVRAGTYPNSEVERETIQRADHAADAIVHRHTELMRTDAGERVQQSSALLRVSDELVTVMVNEVISELQHGGDPKVLAPKYERLEADVQRMVADLRDEAARAELLADRLDDPAEDYERLIERLPALKRGIQW